MTSYTVMILDDDRSFVEAVTLFLEHHGYRTIATYRGEEALERIREGGIDLAIVDVNLPGISGLEVLQRMRADGREIPVILISSDHDPAIRERSRAAGAWKFLAKPLAPDDLLGSVARVLGNGS